MSGAPDPLPASPDPASARARHEFFAELWREWSPRAAAYARAFPWLGPEDREDLVSEAFRKVWGSLDRYDPTRPFGPWFFTILRRLALDLRDRRREPLLPPGQADADPAPVDPAGFSLEREEESAFVRRFVESLALRDRELASLVYGQDLGPSAAARIIGMAAGTAKWRLHVIRQGLRKAYEQEYGQG